MAALCAQHGSSEKQVVPVEGDSSTAAGCIIYINYRRTLNTTIFAKLSFAHITTNTFPFNTNDIRLL